MTNPQLDALGKMLMEAVRDESISDLRMVLSGAMKGDDAERVRDKLKPLDPTTMAALDAVMPDFVDQVLHNLLNAVEEDADIEITVAGAPELRASEKSDGLAGELYGKRGWIARFSKNT